VKQSIQMLEFRTFTGSAAEEWSEKWQKCFL